MAVIVVSFNVESYLRRCLSSLVTHMRGLDFKIVVVDNNSMDRSVEVAREILGANGQIIEVGQNIGYGRAINLGVAALRAKNYLIVNPDCEVFSDIVSTMVRYCANNPRVGVVGCKMLNSDGEVQFNLDTLPGLLYVFAHLTRAKALLRFRLFSSLLRKMPFVKSLDGYISSVTDVGMPKIIEVVPGSFFLIDGELFRKLGGFDERIFLYYEDADLFFRIKKDHRYEVHLLSAGGVVHHHGRSFSQAFTDMSPYKQWSFLYYFRKNQSRASYMVVRVLLFVTTLVKIFAVMPEILKKIPRAGQYFKDCLVVMRMSVCGLNSFNPFRHLQAKS